MKKFIFGLSVILAMIMTIVSVCSLGMTLLTFVNINSTPFCLLSLQYFNALVYFGLVFMLISIIVYFLPEVKYSEEDRFKLDTAKSYKYLLIFSVSCFGLGFLMKLIVFDSWLHLA